MRKTDLSMARQQRLVPVGSHSGAFAYVPEPTPVWLPLGNVAAAGVRAAGETLARLRGIAESVPNSDLFTRTLDRREAVRSSQIEGTQSDLHDLLEYEITGDAEGLSRDTGVTYGYVKALHAGLIEIRQRGPQAFSVELIHRLHSILMEQDERYASANMPGAFKTRQNWIGSGRTIYDARFVPAPPEAVPAAIDDLVHYLQGEAYRESPYVPEITLRMAIAHAQFETIHPYPDGNGRVGRLLLPLMLAADAAPPVYLSGYLKSRQREYYDVLSGVQLRGEWDAWVTFFSATVASCADETSQLILAARALRDDWRTRLKGYRADAAVHRVVDLLLARPVVMASSLAEELRVSFPTANTAVSQMIAAGILRATQARQRKRVFYAPELLSLIERGDGT